PPCAALLVQQRAGAPGAQELPGLSPRILVFFELSVLSEKTRAFRVRDETIAYDLILDPNPEGCVARRNYSHVLRSSRQRDRSDQEPRTRRGGSMNAQEMSHTYGYIRASTDKQIASPETQKQIIEDYATRIGKSVDRYLVDPATSGKKKLH